MHNTRFVARLLLLPLLSLLAGCGPGGGEAGFGLVVPRTEALLPQLGQEPLDIAIIRQDYTLPVVVSAVGLPAGVRADPVVVPGTARDDVLRFSADRDAPLGDHSVTLVATGDGEVDRTTTITLTVGGPRLSPDYEFGEGPGLTIVEGLDRELAGKVEHHVSNVFAEPSGEIVVTGTRVTRGAAEERWYWFLMRFAEDGTHLATATRPVRALHASSEPGAMSTRMHSAIRTRGGGYLCVGMSSHTDIDLYNQYIVYFAADGSWDTTIGVIGLVLGAPLGSVPGYVAHDVIELTGSAGEGRFLVVGEVPHDDVGHVMSLTRYHADLKIDPSFGSGGTIEVPFGHGSSGARRVAAVSNDALIVGGWHSGTNPPVDRDFALLWLHADGTPDLTRGAAGELTYDMTETDELADLLTMRGKMVIGGSTGTPPQGVLARFVSAGRDPTFPVTALLPRVGPGVVYEGLRFHALAQTDYAKYAVGQMEWSGGSYALICRFTEDGILDTSVQDDGRVTYRLGSQQSEFTAIAVQGYKLLCAGASDGNVALKRLWH